MTIQNQKVLEIKLIKEKLETAAFVEKLLPNVKVNGYIPLGLRFPIKYTSQEIVFMDKKPIKLAPTREQITIWEMVILEWFPLLDAEERKLVWKRANHIPWKIICFEFQKSRQILTSRLNKALQKIGDTFCNKI